MEIINWKELLYPYEQAVEELLLKFKNLDKECRHLGIYSPVDSVTGRLKTPASILDKAGRKHIAPEHIEEEIEDIAGIRILCQFVEDIQKVVDMVRSRSDMTIVQEKDYITNTMSTIREEITNAQRLNEIRRKMTSNILDNIRKLHFMLNLEDMSAINKEFSDVWNSNDIDKLREFNERLNVLVEVYRI